MMESNPVKPRPPRVVLADDHILLLDALARLLAPDFDVVAKVGDGEALLVAVREFAPDVIVADIGMPLMSGLAAAQKITTEQPGANLILLTMHADPSLAAQGFRSGAKAYVLKSAAASELTTAIRNVVAGSRYLSPAICDGDVERLLAGSTVPGVEKKLTPREIEVIRHLVAGQSMKQAARLMAITPRTIAFHKYKIMQQLGLKSNAELFQYAQKHGIVDPG